MQIRSIFIIITIRIAILALPLIFTNCASTGDPAGQGVEELGRTVEEHLPGLGSGPESADYDDPALR